MIDRQRLGLVSALGLTQTLAWASSYYLPAIIADRMARDTGVSPTWIFAAFSISLATSGLLGPRVGRTIDLLGGRGVLAVSNLILATGLLLLAVAQGPLTLAVAWLVLGMGMGLGLYDTAFATLGRIYGDTARGAITGISLIAGFASTIGWPLTAWGAEALGWRATCLAWAVAHITIGLPLNLLFIPKAAKPPASVEKTALPRIAMDRTMWLLAFAFAAGWTVSTAMAAHLPRILEAAGATTVQAVAAGALIGPAQVAARVLEAGFLSRFHPLLSARLSTLTHPIGAALLLIGGGGLFSSAFTLLHGAGNGILTIARGTVPLAVFGPENYGYRLGLIGAPARITQAAAPLLFGVLIERWGSGVLYVSSALCLCACVSLVMVGPILSGSSTSQ